MEWRDIGGRYQISDTGLVKRKGYTQYNPLTDTYSHFKDMIRKPFLSRGYYRVKLTLDGKEVNKSIHRLVGGS